MPTTPSTRPVRVAEPYATMPTRWTLFLRTFWPWQAWRFIVINLKMLRLAGRHE